MEEDKFLGWGWPEELKEVFLKAEDLKKQFYDLMESDFALHKKTCRKWRHAKCSRSKDINIQLNTMLKEHASLMLESIRIQRMLPEESRGFDEQLERIEEESKKIIEQPRNDIPISFNNEKWIL